jgi:hypothetical protein
MENNAVTPKHDSTARAVFSAIFGVIAILLLIPTTVAVWFNFQVLNTKNASTTLTKVIVLPGVSDIIAESLASGIVEGATTSDLSQAILTPEQQALDEQAQLDAIHKVIKAEIRNIIATPTFSSLIQSESQKALNTFFDIAIGKNSTAIINFNPLIAGVINSTKGTKIAIIGDKFALDDKVGVITLTPQNVKDIKNYYNTARTTMVVELVLIALCLLLSILLANHRFKALRRLALVAGIIYTIYGLVLLLVPQVIVAVIKDAQATAGIEIVKFVINPLTYFSLITGVVLLVAVIISAIIGKATAGTKTKKETPTKETTEHQHSEQTKSTQHSQKSK